MLSGGVAPWQRYDTTQRPQTAPEVAFSPVGGGGMLDSWSTQKEETDQPIDDAR